MKILLPNDVNPIMIKPQNPQQRVFECPKIPKYSNLGWSTQNPCLAKKNATKTLKYEKRHKDDQPLISLQVQWRTQERTLTSEEF